MSMDGVDLHMPIWHRPVFCLNRIAFACMYLLCIWVYVGPTRFVITGGVALACAVSFNYIIIFEAQLQVPRSIVQCSYKGMSRQHPHPNYQLRLTNYDYGYRPRPPNRASGLRGSEAPQEEEAGEMCPTGGRWCCCAEGRPEVDRGAPGQAPSPMAFVTARFSPSSCGPCHKPRRNHRATWVPLRRCTSALPQILE